MCEVKLLSEKLAEPFEPGEIRWKPQAISGNNAMAVAYINARAVMDRLDEVLGADAWQDDYEFLPNGSVVCRLRCRFGKEWVVHADVGSPSEQPDKGDQTKAAVSDSLKRAAVKFGVGRYLYRLDHAWVPYDSKKKKLEQVPSLPAWALPKPRLVSPAQVQQLEKLLRERDADRAKFLAAYKLTGLYGMPITMFDAAVKQLEKKPLRTAKTSA